MRKIGTEKTDTRMDSGDSKEPAAAPAVNRNWRPLIIVGVIMFLAAFVRVFFAYGVSAGSGFALSGGTVASNNLLALDNLLSDGLVTFFNESLYYPYGSTSVAPMVLTFIMYPFAAIANVFMHDTTTAASFALALSGPLFGVLAVIPMYLLGKEITGKRLGGMLAALFLALCPVAVQETVFSNGTGLSLVLFFSIFAVYFLVKAIKAAGLTDGSRDSAERKPVLKLALVSGILLALAGLCWTGYRAIVLPIAAVMIVQTLVDRFRGRDPMPAAFMYSVVVLLGALVPGIYYAAAGLWDAVASGTTVLALLASALCVAYSACAKKPWTLVLPIFIIIAVAAFAVMWFAMPDLFSAVIGGNNMMNGDYQGILAANRLSLSRLAAYFGWMTFWFIPLIVAYRLLKIKQNVVSPLYMFVLVWLLAVPIASCSTASEACAASAAFALAFALLTIWVLDHVDFKAYFSGIKTAEGKYKIKRFFKPTPFIAILLALFLVAGPNVFYVVDAGISSNEAQEVNDDLGTDRFGGIGYYVPTDDTWQVPDALEQLKDEVPGITGSMAGWIDYSNNIPMYGGFDSFTDTQGNGLLELSQILLANGIDGSSPVAMLIAMLKYTGFTDPVRDALTAAGLTAEDWDLIVNVMNDADYKISDKQTVRKAVTLDAETYGHMSADITDANISAMYLEHFLTEKNQSYQISDMYEAVCGNCEKSIDHVMISGDMIPLYYSDAFTQMALMAGYTIDSNSGAITGMMDIDWLQYYTTGRAVFTYTDRMYDTLLYRMYIGMSPAEAGYSNLNSYITALQHADRSVQMFPGYGLSNFKLTYWHVMYNPADGADPADKDGWIEMKGIDAVARQALNGGTINYLSGKPVIFSYADNEDGAQCIQGTIKNASEQGIEGIRVSAIDDDGVLRATTYTGEDGRFMLNVPVYEDADSYSTIVYYAASTGTTGGALLKAVKVADGAVYDMTDVQDKSPVTVTLRYYSGGAEDITYNTTGADKFEITFTGKNTGEVYTKTLADFHNVQMKLDFYDVTVKYDGQEVYKGTYSVVNNPSHSPVFELDAVKYTVNLENIYSECPDDIKFIKLSGDIEAYAPVVDGSAEFSIPKGDYTVTFCDASKARLPYLSTDSKLSITSDRSEDVTVIPAAEITVDGANNSAVTVSNDVYSITFVPTAENNTVMVPVSDIGTTSYTVSSTENGKLRADLVQVSNGSTAVTADLKTAVETVEVTGTINNAAGKGTSATVKFMLDSGAVLTFASDSEGKYKAYIPANAKASMYVNNGNDAIFKAVGPYAENATLDITLGSANHISEGVKWGSYDYPYTDVSVKISGYDGESEPVTWTFTTSQHNTGDVQSSFNEYSFYMPSGAEAVVSCTVRDDCRLWFEHETVENKDNAPVGKFVTCSYTIESASFVGKDFSLCADKTIKIVIDEDLRTALDGYDLKVEGSTTSDVKIDKNVSEYAFTMTGKTSTISVTVGIQDDKNNTDVYCKSSYSVTPDKFGVDASAAPALNMNVIAGVEDSGDFLNSFGYRSVYVKLAEGATFSLTDSGRLKKVSEIKDAENPLDGYTWYQIKCEYDDEGIVDATLRTTLKDKVMVKTIPSAP